MNQFLLSRDQISEATEYLEKNGLVQSGLSCKNWEVYHVMPYMKDGNWLDLGSDGGVVLENLVKINISGIKIGIDLAYPEDIVSQDKGISLVKGDCMNVPFPDSFFNFITCLSVIEHSVDYEKFAHECARLLSKGGQLFVSFDYATEKLDTSKTKLYSLSWNVLCKKDLEEFIKICAEHGLELSSEINWELKEMVINPQYCSPAQVEYTFGILQFIKK